MARYSSYKVLDYCYHPLKILRDGEWLYVPCNKCDGCLLHKANLWSQRLSYEIDHNPFSIFFTLTYNNKYLPTLVPILDHYNQNFNDPNNNYVVVNYISDHCDNIRFNGFENVLREDHICILSKLKNWKITNDPRKYVVNYASKRDFQLWLKLLRKDIIENLNPDYGSESFRYFGISEKGPTKHRWHMHGILFPRNKEIADYLLSVSMFKNWKMCDEVLFREHTKYCDSGTSTYVTNYVTGISRLPAIYKDPAVKPFRLSSKSPAIGYAAFDAQEIFENLSIGVVEYTRRLSDPEQSPTLCYPSDYMARLVPKCYKFAELSNSRLLFVYGCLYRLFFRPLGDYLALYDRLRKVLHPSDWQAAQACKRYCDLLGCTPFHYLYCLDLYYYKRAMSALKMWYTWQEENINFPIRIILSYSNFYDYVLQKSFLSTYQIAYLRTFCESFGLVFDDLSLDDLKFFIDNDPSKDLYRQDVSQIVDNLEKMPKFNELNGSSPHCF